MKTTRWTRRHPKIEHSQPELTPGELRAEKRAEKSNFCALFVTIANSRQFSASSAPGGKKNFQHRLAITALMFPAKFMLPIKSLQRELWQTLVFCGDGALGNPTGTVFLDGALPDADCLRIAAALGFPDTAFLSSGDNGADWTARFFSPVEALTLCVQATLGSLCALIAGNKTTPGARILFRTPGGEVTAFSDGAGDQESFWVEFPAAATEMLEPVRTGALARFPTLGVAVGAVVAQNKRKRCYVSVTAPTIEGFSADPGEMRAFCADADVSGLCLVSVGGANAVRLRVFTSSLEGREDNSTGGAVAGLKCFLASTGAATPKAGETWTISQGYGAAHKKGLLLLRAESDKVYVGGRCRLIARGVLMP